VLRQLAVKPAARTSDRRQFIRSGFLDERIIANAFSEAGFAIADGQVSGDLVPRSQLTPKARSFVELLRNRCEPQIGKAKAPTIAVGIFVGTLLQNGGHFWVVPTLRLARSIAVTI
jgi:hypothetical protein